MKKNFLIGFVILFLNMVFLGGIIADKIFKMYPLQSQEKSDEEALEKLDFREKINEEFGIYTLDEIFGDSVETYVFLDPNVISYDDLRYLAVLHVGFDGLIHKGELIVNELIAEEVLSIFRSLYDVGFPIEQMKLISEFENSDFISMDNNNTSGFNFRKKTGLEELSMHAYGLAIDINPLINPYVYGEVIFPTNASLYVDRNQEALGLITTSSAAYSIFKSYGWNWGGDWTDLKDYQHFEKPMPIVGEE